MTELMFLFVDSLNTVRERYQPLTLDEKGNALNLLSNLIEQLTEIQVREKVEDEAAKSVAGEAERMIMERFADNWALLELSDGSSFWEESRARLHFPVEESTMDMDPSQSETSVSCEIATDLCIASTSQIDDQPSTSYQENGKSDVRENRETTDSFESKQGRADEFFCSETRLRCSTCGHEASNRKALYRHGLREQHATRPLAAFAPSSRFNCALCTFSTNKKFNYDRHLQRTHFIIRNHDCPECGALFKDNDTLRGHVKKVHQKK